MLEQARSQVFWFEGENGYLWGQDFVFIICLKYIFLGTTKFGGFVLLRLNLLGQRKLPIVFPLSGMLRV